ncbi:MAG: hypothetical protein EOO88_03545 [Pedobacter sp.]|nr:MAG: hypothetical protein EOO88_03545 [Pedobacter sp.]
MIIKWFKFLILASAIAGSFYIVFLHFNEEQNVLELQKRPTIISIILLILWVGLCWLIVKRFQRKNELTEHLYQQHDIKTPQWDVHEVVEETVVTPEEIVPEEPSPYKLINLRGMKQRSVGDAAYEKKEAALFITCVPQQLADLQIKYENGDIFGINAAAHQLKITADIMGLRPHLEEELDQLEYVKSDALEIPDLIDTVASVFGDALIEAKAYYQTL